MHPELRTVFNFFLNYEVAIIGSALKNFETAHDIDVLLPASVNFRALCALLQIPYRGKWRRCGKCGKDSRIDTCLDCKLPVQEIRQAKLVIPGVTKPVQITQNSVTVTFDQHPQMVLLRDGTVLHDGIHFDKEAYVRSRQR